MPADNTATRPGTFDMGVTAAVRWIENRLDTYVLKHGCTDPETGAMEFGRGHHAQAKDEYVAELMEIIEGLRGLKPGGVQP